MADGDGVAHAHAEVGRGLRRERDAGAARRERALRGAGRPAGSRGIERRQRAGDLLVAGLQLDAELVLGAGAARLGEADDVAHRPPADLLVASEVHEQAIRRDALGLGASPVQRGEERVDEPAERHDERDDQADPDDRHQGAARRADEVAQRHLDEAPAGDRQARQQRGEAPAARGAEAHADRLDRRHPHGAPDGQQHAEHGQRHADGGADEEAPGQERRVVDRQRQDGLQERSEDERQQVADHDPEHGPEHGDLRAHEDRAQRQARRRDAERHADPDLAPLGLHGAADQVVRGQRGAEQHERREDDVDLLVALRVLVEQAVGLLVDALRDGHADAGKRGGEGPPQLRRELRVAHPGRPAHDDLVHLVRAAGDPLRRPQRGEEHGVVGGARPEVRARAAPRRRRTAAGRPTRRTAAGSRRRG